MDITFTYNVFDGIEVGQRYLCQVRTDGDISYEVLDVIEWEGKLKFTHDNDDYTSSNINVLARSAELFDPSIMVNWLNVPLMYNTPYFAQFEQNVLDENGLDETYTTHPQLVVATQVENGNIEFHSFPSGYLMGKYNRALETSNLVAISKTCVQTVTFEPKEK